VLSNVISQLESVRSAPTIEASKTIEASNLFELEAQIVGLIARSPDEKIRFFVAASALDRMATSLDRSASGEASTSDYRDTLMLIERILVGNMAAAEQAIVAVIDIVGPKPHAAH